MIKAFRNIRHNVLQSGKLKSYAIYALGEIFLVVIGILIAVQINNWNENKKASIIEQTYLGNMKRDLHEQLKSIDQQLEFETSCARDASYIKRQYQKQSEFVLDSIFFLKATHLTVRRTFIITDPTYTELISSGNIDMIKDRKLKDQLIKYYQELERVEQVIRTNNTNLVDLMYYPVYIKTGYIFSNYIVDLLTSEIEDESMTFQLNYSDKIKNMSGQMMSVKENELQLLNVINERHSISLTHYKMLRKIKNETIALINTFKT